MTAIVAWSLHAEESTWIAASFEPPGFEDVTMEGFFHTVEKRALHPLDPSPSQGLFEALDEDDAGKFFEALVAGQSPDGVNALGDTVLCAAIRAGNEFAVKWLLDAGASPYYCGLEGQTPLWVAWVEEKPRMVEILLEKGVDPDTRFYGPADELFLGRVKDALLRRALIHDEGLTLLMAASAVGDTSLIRLLLKHKAKENLHTKRYSRYAINYAAMNQRIGAMQLILGYEPEPGTELVVDLSEQEATYFKTGEKQFNANVSTGKKGYRTPTGTYVITNKYKSWTSTLYHASMPYFQRLSCGDFGFHAGHVPGYPASHGCIRLSPSSARKFFTALPLGTKVRIVP